MFNKKADKIIDLEYDLLIAQRLSSDYERREEAYGLTSRQKWLAHQALDYVYGWLHEAAAETAVKDGADVVSVNEITSLAAECVEATEPLRNALGIVLNHENPFVKHLDN